MALPVNGSTHLIPAYFSFYRPRKDERLSCRYTHRKKRYKQKENITTESTKYKQAVTIATAVDLSQINITQGRGTDRRTDGRVAASLNAPCRRAGHNNLDTWRVVQVAR